MLAFAFAAEAPGSGAVDGSIAMSGAGGGIAGMSGGSFFKAPGWVDLTKPPGASTQVPPPWSAWAKGVLKCNHVIFSPNLVWLSHAVLVWVLFPYDLEAAKTWRVGWVAQRCAINLALVYFYFGFWHAALYILGWSKRKFMPENMPSRGRVLHNVWYTTLGALQGAAWEVIMMHIYATDRIPFIRDEEAFASREDILRMIFWCAKRPPSSWSLRPSHLLLSRPAPPLRIRSVCSVNPAPSDQPPQNTRPLPRVRGPRSF